MAVTPDWTGRQGDTAKTFDFVCQDTNGPVDISTADAVKFHLTKSVGKPPVIDADCVIIDDGSLPLRGKGKYVWNPGETDDLVGVYYAEVEVQRAGDDAPLTFPDGEGAYAVLEFSKQIA